MARHTAKSLQSTKRKRISAPSTIFAGNWVIDWDSVLQPALQQAHAEQANTESLCQHRSCTTPTTLKDEKSKDTVIEGRKTSVETQKMILPPNMSYYYENHEITLENSLTSSVQKTSESQKDEMKWEEGEDKMKKK